MEKHWGGMESKVTIQIEKKQVDEDGKVKEEDHQVEDDVEVPSLKKEMSELIAKAMKPRNAMAMEALAFSVKSSFPQFDSQSFTLVAALDDADTNRYATT